MRYKLIPSRGRKRSRYVEGELATAVAKAQESYDKDGIPVLVVEAEQGGLTKPVQMVPPAPKRVRSRAKGLA